MCRCVDVSEFDKALPEGVCESQGSWATGAATPNSRGGEEEERIPCGPYFCTVFPEIERHDSVPFASRWLCLLERSLRRKDFPCLLFP